MRKVLLLAAMLIAPALAPAEAGDRGHRHFAPHAGARIFAPQPGMRFHGGHFDHGRHARPRHFDHPRGGFVFGFHGGRSGVVPAPRFHGPRFRMPRHHGGRVFRFGGFPHSHAWRSTPRHAWIWHDRRFRGRH